jgi:homoserine O-acetyltransferase
LDKKPLNFLAVEILEGQIKVPLTYYMSGPNIGTAPVVLINHPLTANAIFSGVDGWWNEIVGPSKVIDTNIYTVISFNIPGNGIDSYKWKSIEKIHTGLIAKLFINGLKKLGITDLYAIIGGSIGGGISWEMAVLSPKLCKHLIPIASDWKSTDWVIANTFIQKQILKNSKDPILDARMHAMLLYRTPESFSSRFARSENEYKKIFNVESWLLHHGQALKNRFTLDGYLLVNHLLGSINILRNNQNFDTLIEPISAEIHLISVDSDLLFIPDEDKSTYNRLKKLQKKCFFYEINSVHGHDAFLIENNQVKTILNTIFKN